MKISVEVVNVSGKMILKQALGEGEYGDKKLTLASAIPDGSPIIKVDEGDVSATYKIRMSDIVEAVVEGNP